MNEKNLNHGFILTCAVTLIGWGVTFGVCKNKIDHNTKAIDRLDRQQIKSFTDLQIISNQLSSLNTKIDLLLDGKIQFDNDD